MNFGFWIADFGLRGFWNADFGFWILVKLSICGFAGKAVVDCLLQAAFQLAHSSAKSVDNKVTRSAAKPFQNPQSKIQNQSAFSLVEVTLAIGIVAFALLAVVALLPVGLRSVKNATEQAGAAMVLNSLADELRSATSQNGTNFTGSFAGKSFSYAIDPIGGQVAETSWNNLTLEGGEETTSSPKRLSAVLRVFSPLNAAFPGRATISVAWSAQANPEWNATTQTWIRAEGSITSGIQFLPRK